MKPAVWRAWPGPLPSRVGTTGSNADPGSADRADVLTRQAPTAHRSPGPDASADPRGGTAQALGLAPRHCEVLYYLCQGLPNKSIANCMGISEGTVRKSYVSDLLRFFGVARRTELMMEVARRRLEVKPPG